MSNLFFTLVRDENGDSNITVIASGDPTPRVAHESHPHFADIVAGALEDDSAILDLFDIASTAATRFESLSERISVANGRVYLDGDEVNDALTDQIIRFVEEGVEDWRALVAFYEHVQANPSQHSREQLYRWLKSHNFTITHDGLIVGYKYVLESAEHGYTSSHAGPAIVNGEAVDGFVPNPIGAIITMPRSSVHEDPRTSCSTGLHVANWGYVAGHTHILEVHVNPRDVVSVPTDAGDAKVRCCRYQVIRQVTKPYTVAVLPPPSLVIPAAQWSEPLETTPPGLQGLVLAPATPQTARSKAKVAVKPQKAADKAVQYVVPSLKVWAEMKARAKRRKQNFRKYAEHNGWKYSGSLLTSNPAVNRTDWLRPR